MRQMMRTMLWALIMTLVSAAWVFAPDAPTQDPPKKRLPAAWANVISLDLKAMTLTARVTQDADTKRGDGGPKVITYTITETTLVRISKGPDEFADGTWEDVKPGAPLLIAYEPATEKDAKPVAVMVRVRWVNPEKPTE